PRTGFAFPFSKTLNEVVTILSGHPDIGRDDRRFPVSGFFQPLFCGTGITHFGSTFFEYGSEQLTSIGLVIDDEDAHTLQPRSPREGEGFLRFRFGMYGFLIYVPRMYDHERKTYSERRALTFAGALGADASAVQFDELSHDCQAQS